MHHSYDDIRERICGDPTWFDEHAVPRYRDFAPGEQANIYADRVALALIACQNCGRRFKVAFSSGATMRLMYGCPGIWPLIMDRSLHYGDPPNIECCPAGPTMSCEDLRVLEAWERVNLEWVRKPEHEIELNDEVAERSGPA